MQDTGPTLNENLVGRVPCDSTLAMTDGQFRIAGEMMATSIVQGGPAPDFLSDWVYNYFSSGIEGVIVDETKIANQRIRNLIERVSLKYQYLLPVSTAFAKPKTVMFTSNKVISETFTN